MAGKKTKNVKKSIATASSSHGSRSRHGLGRGLGALIGDVDLSEVTGKASPSHKESAAKATPVVKKSPARKPAPTKKAVTSKKPSSVPVSKKPSEPVEKAPVGSSVAEEVKVAIELDEPVVEDSLPVKPLPAGNPPGAEEPVSGEKAHGASVLQVATYLISRSPWQPRVDFNQDSLSELSESIKAHGVIQPLVCRRLPGEKGGGYELIAGERRLRAAIDAGLTEVPIVVMEAIDRDAAEMAIIENIQRQDLNVIEEAEGYRTLAEEFNLTQQEVASRVGKARASVANILRLLELPDEIKQFLSSSMLSVGHAKVLLSLPDETEQILLARRCVTEGLTVRALERLIERRKAAKVQSASRTIDIPESHIRYLLDKLHERFNSPIRLQPSVTYANGKRAKGSIQIDFADNEDLSRLLDLLGVKVD